MKQLDPIQTPEMTHQPSSARELKRDILCVHSGDLYRQFPHDTGRWMYRQCMIHSDFFYYFGEEYDSNPILTLPLNEFQVSEVDNESRKFVFQLSGGDESHVFAATSQDQLQAWLQGFKTAGKIHPEVDDVIDKTNEEIEVESLLADNLDRITEQNEREAAEDIKEPSDTSEITNIIQEPEIVTEFLTCYDQTNNSYTGITGTELRNRLNREIKATRNTTAIGYTSFVSQHNRALKLLHEPIHPLNKEVDESLGARLNTHPIHAYNKEVDESLSERLNTQPIHAYNQDIDESLVARLNTQKLAVYKENYNATEQEINEEIIAYKDDKIIGDDIEKLISNEYVGGEEINHEEIIHNEFKNQQGIVNGHVIHEIIVKNGNLKNDTIDPVIITNRDERVLSDLSYREETIVNGNVDHNEIVNEDVIVQDLLNHEEILASEYVNCDQTVNPEDNVNEHCNKREINPEQIVGDFNSEKGDANGKVVNEKIKDNTADDEKLIHKETLFNENFINEKIVNELTNLGEISDIEPVNDVEVVTDNHVINHVTYDGNVSQLGNHEQSVVAQDNETITIKHDEQKLEQTSDWEIINSVNSTEEESHQEIIVTTQQEIIEEIKTPGNSKQTETSTNPGEIVEDFENIVVLQQSPRQDTKTSTNPDEIVGNFEDIVVLQFPRRDSKTSTNLGEVVGEFEDIVVLESPRRDCIMLPEDEEIASLVSVRKLRQAYEPMPNATIDQEELTDEEDEITFEPTPPPLTELSSFANISYELQPKEVGWNKRWVVFKENTLWVFKNQEEQAAVRVLRISGVELHPAALDTGRLLAFKLVHSGKLELVIEPDTVEDLGLWVSVLFRAIQQSSAKPHRIPNVHYRVSPKLSPPSSIISKPARIVSAPPSETPPATRNGNLLHKQHKPLRKHGSTQATAPLRRTISLQLLTTTNDACISNSSPDEVKSLEDKLPSVREAKSFFERLNQSSGEDGSSDVSFNLSRSVSMTSLMSSSSGSTRAGHITRHNQNVSIQEKTADPPGSIPELESTEDQTSTVSGNGLEQMNHVVCWLGRYVDQDEERRVLESTTNPYLCRLRINHKEQCVERLLTAAEYLGQELTNLHEQLAQLRNGSYKSSSENLEMKVEEHKRHLASCLETIEETRRDIKALYAMVNWGELGFMDNYVIYNLTNHNQYITNEPESPTAIHNTNGNGYHIGLEENSGNVIGNKPDSPTANHVNNRNGPLPGLEENSSDVITNEADGGFLNNQVTCSPIKENDMDISPQQAPEWMEKAREKAKIWQMLNSDT